MEPPPSLPCASGTMPLATAAAAPPLEPPGVRSVSQGFRAGPYRRGSDTGRIPNSGMFVLPTRTKPASRMRRVTYESWSGTKSPKMSEPIVYGMPLTAVVSLIAMGTPAKGRGSSLSMPAAVSSAPSASTWMKAFSDGCSCSIRSRAAETSSVELTCPVCTSVASSVAGL